MDNCNSKNGHFQHKHLPAFLAWPGADHQQFEPSLAKAGIGKVRTGIAKAGLNDLRHRQASLRRQGTVWVISVRVGVSCPLRNLQQDRWEGSSRWETEQATHQRDRPSRFDTSPMNSKGWARLASVQLFPLLKGNAARGLVEALSDQYLGGGLTAPVI